MVELLILERPFTPMHTSATILLFKQHTDVFCALWIDYFSKCEVLTHTAFNKFDNRLCGIKAFHLHVISSLLLEFMEMGGKTFLSVHISVEFIF